MKRGVHVAYDERFHVGVNVVRGDNSSGKSTILNFIFFGLGGDLSKLDWSGHALLCDHVWLEVELNGNPAVLRRKIDAASQSDMEIFGGRYEAAVEAPIESWLRYSYSRSQNKESFSQALFRLLGMPDVAVEGTSSITMHQVLRLLYADQLSPTDSLFRFEGYDPENLREAVGNLLCGAFDTAIYESQQLRRLKERELQEVSAELRSIFRVVGGEESLGLGWISQKRASLLADRERVLESIAEKEELFYSSAASDRLTLTQQKELYNAVQKLQQELAAAQEALSGIEFEISDSQSFIESLKRKVEALKDARLAAEIVPDVHFATCPACYADVLEAEEHAFSCHLCKTPIDPDRARDRVTGIINELSIQIKQSERLQGIRGERLKTQASKVDSLKTAWTAKSRELAAITARPTSKVREDIRELHRQLGYIDKSIEDVEAQVKLANKIGDLSARRESLDLAIKDLDSRILSLKRSQTDRLRVARTAIERETITILKGDLKRQDSFVDPKTVDFSFGKNSITVDDHTYFSASSRVVLKTAFLVGFLGAALKDPQFRHPRFLMIDITEDKGMEQARSHNFQRQVIETSAASPVEHQVIFATAMPWSEIPEQLFVGRFSTLEKGTLNFL
ncbi:ATP-binding protein [Phyllobacterium sp. YR531]|uniref:ATP-binding protein n=1 Tax=Phyllobacterium sp. YR531 TaxID=1144343 RepID=UPI001930C245|nr:ATP-binding protein [Phyllobacterium sp. YR531]